MPCSVSGWIAPAGSLTMNVAPLLMLSTGGPTAISTGIASRPHRLRAVPEAEAAEESVRVVAEPGSRWKLRELRRVSTADHDLVRLERCPEALEHVQHVLPPALLAVALEPPDADVILERAPFLVREMPE